MIDEDNAVNPGESAAPEQEQVVNEEQQGAPEATEQQSQENIPAEQGQVQSEAFDENGVPWKNRAMEWQRKFQDNIENLPKIVEETMSKYTKPQEREYTIEELEQVALSNPNLRPQVEAEKARLLEKRLELKISEQSQKMEKSRKDDQVRIQTENWIANHPSFKECFVNTPTGDRQWNVAHPLTQVISQVMTNPELKNRPDGLAIGAEIAYGRYMLNNMNKSKTQVKNLQTTLRKEQKKTLIEPGTTRVTQSRDELTSAKEQLARTGNKKDAQIAVKAYLKKAGIISQE